MIIIIIIIKMTMMILLIIMIIMIMIMIMIIIIANTNDRGSRAAELCCSRGERLGLTLGRERPPPRSCSSRGGRGPDHRWNRNPRPQPQKFSKLVFLMKFS